MITDIKGLVREQNHSPGADGTEKKVDLSRVGQVFDANWKHHLVAAGLVHRLSFGTISAGTDITGLSGHATLDLDQPEWFVAQDVGFYLIPIEFEVGVQDNNVAYENEVEILVTADRTQAVIAGGTFVEATGNLSAGTSIQNVLGGGAAFGGRTAATVTGDINDPVHADVLAYRLWETKQIATEVLGLVTPLMEYQKEWDVPTFLAGPCSILGYIAGSVQPTYVGSFTFAAVPNDWHG